MATIRRAGEADEPQLLALTPRLADFTLPAWRDASQIALADHAILTNALRTGAPNNVVLVVEDVPSHIAGYVFATTRTDYFTGRPHAHIEILAVARAAEGRGFGRLLLGAAESWARERGLAHVTLNVFSGNERARRLYEAIGYEAELVTYRKALSEHT